MNNLTFEIEFPLSTLDGNVIKVSKHISSFFDPLDVFDGPAPEAEELLRQGGDAGDWDGRAADDDGRKASRRRRPTDRNERSAHGPSLRHHEQIPQ